MAKALILRQDYLTLSDDLYSIVKPAPLKNPFIIHKNTSLIEELGIFFPEIPGQENLLAISSGAVEKLQHDFIAMKYAGHQFGQYNPELGDGRGILLGNFEGLDHQYWELHLKGSGQTPYSRFGDGRAVLRSTIREYLGSEAIAGLGIASSRALCITGSDTAVQRETIESAATLIRACRSHIRFGHFEYYHYTKRYDEVKALADFVIKNNYPHFAEQINPYISLFESCVNNTAIMIANWQAYGFAHGVMNTDNMSILGDTFDYGPYAFMDDFEPNLICNYSDHTGRYAFDKQPHIGQWNVYALANAMSSLIDTDSLKVLLARYEACYQQHYETTMLKKLGLSEQLETDKQLINHLLNALSTEKLDYHQFFRKLSYGLNAIEFTEYLDAIDGDSKASLDKWLEAYDQRITLDDKTAEQRNKDMLSCNPNFVLRNHLAQQAIEQAEQGNYQMIGTLLNMAQSPFDEYDDTVADLLLPPKEHQKHLVISCSS